MTATLGWAVHSMNNWLYFQALTFGRTYSTVKSVYYLIEISRSTIGPNLKCNDDIEVGEQTTD